MTFPANTETWHLVDTDQSEKPTLKTSEGVSTTLEEPLLFLSGMSNHTEFFSYRSPMFITLLNTVYYINKVMSQDYFHIVTVTL